MISLFKKKRIRTYLLVLFLCSFTIIPFELISSPITVSILTNEDFCNLSAPTNLHTTGTTSTSISVAWNPVTNSNGYHLKAQIVGGAVLFDGIVPNTSATITAPSGIPVQIDVSSVCSTGELGGTSTIFEQADFVIIQDITSGLSVYNPNTILQCATFQLDNIERMFKVYTQGFSAVLAHKSFSIIGKINAISGASIKVGYYNVDSNDQLPTLIDQNGGTWRFMNIDDEYPTNLGEVYSGSSVIIKYSLFNNNNFTQVGVLTFSHSSGSNIFEVCFEGLSPNASVKYHLGGGLSTDPNPTSFAQLSPNPFSDALTLYLDDPAPERSILRIFDLNGREVLKQDIEPSVTSATVDFESTLKPGIYLARFESPEGVHMLKIVKTQ